jgi:hypothetical protein
VTADHALVERIVAETRVETTPVTPGWTGWIEALSTAALQWIGDRIPGMPRLDWLAESAGPAAKVVGVMLVGVLLYLIARLLIAGRAARPTRPPAAAAARSHAAAAPGRDAASWRREFERRLADGDLPAALRALWWWFARAVSPGHVDESWTTRELLARCGRADLGPLAGALDQWLYGTRKPGGDELAGFLGRAEAALR